MLTLSLIIIAYLAIASLAYAIVASGDTEDHDADPLVSARLRDWCEAQPTAAHVERWLSEVRR